MMPIDFDALPSIRLHAMHLPQCISNSHLLPVWSIRDTSDGRTFQQLFDSLPLIHCISNTSIERYTFRREWKQQRKSTRKATHFPPSRTLRMCVCVCRCLFWLYDVLCAPCTVSDWVHFGICSMWHIPNETSFTIVVQQMSQNVTFATETKCQKKKWAEKKLMLFIHLRAGFDADPL